MRIKAPSLVIKFGRAAVLLMFLFAEFFGFGVVKPHLAQAACSYQITEFAAKNPSSWSYIQSATPADTIAIVSTLKKSGTATECSVAGTSSIVDQIEFNGKNGWVVLASQRDSGINYSNGTGQYIYNLNLGSFDRSKLASTNQLDLRLKICREEAQAYGEAVVTNCTQINTSSTYTVNITGAGTTSGSVYMNVYTKPNQATYKKGDTIQVLAYIPDKTQITGLDSSITNINFETYINGKKVGSFANSRNSFASTDQHQDNITVSEQNGFINGTNTVKVELWQSNTSIKISEGTATLQAQGLSTAAGSTTQPGTGNQPGDGSGIGNQSSGGIGNQPGTPAPAPVDCTGPNPDPKYCIYNPLPESELTPMLLTIMKGFLGIIAVWAVVFIVIGGFKMVMAQGNEEAYTTAKKTITWAILGLVIALLSFAVIAMVQNFLGTDIKPASIIQQ